jgi:hypothetical protein
VNEKKKPARERTSVHEHMVQTLKPAGQFPKTLKSFAAQAFVSTAAHVL